MWGALSDERTGLSFTVAAGARQPSHSRVQVPGDSRTYFYYVRFETSLFVVSYDSQGYGGGIGPRLHKGVDCLVRNEQINTSSPPSSFPASPSHSSSPLPCLLYVLLMLVPLLSLLQLFLLLLIIGLELKYFGFKMQLSVVLLDDPQRAFILIVTNLCFHRLFNDAFSI
jgi:hypothetical protein